MNGICLIGGEGCFGWLHVWGIMLVGCVTVIPRGVGPVWFLVMCKMGN